MPSKTDRLSHPTLHQDTDMHFALCTVALGTIMFTASCDTMQIDTYYDEGVDFRPLKTYQWMDDRQLITGDERVKNQIIKDMIKAAIDDRLGSKGFTQATENPDFLVGYHAAVASQIDVRSTNNTYGTGVPTDAGEAFGPGWNTSGEVRTQVYRYDLGTLVISIAAAVDRKLIWRGSAADRVNPGKTDQQQKRDRIEESVLRILEAFPPY